MSTVVTVKLDDKAHEAVIDYQAEQQKQGRRISKAAAINELIINNTHSNESQNAK